MTSKSLVYSMVAIILATPPFLFTYNKLVLSRTNDLPHDIRKADTPLYSNMYLSKNFSGYSYRFNIDQGFSKFKFSTNDLGLRTPPINYESELILFSGDSTIFGSHLNDDETVPFLLERNLKNQYSVVNAGIPGKGIPHNLLTLKNFIYLSEKKDFKIKIFVNWIKGGDFEFPRSIEDIKKRALKEDLGLKHRLMVRFPSLTAFSANIITPGRLSGFRGSFKKLFLERKNYRFTPNSKVPPSLPSVDLVFERNLQYFLQIHELARQNSIIVLNIIHTTDYVDIVHENTYSDHLEKLLINNGAENIIKVKDIYASNPSVLPKVAYLGKDFAHFTYPASQLIADFIYKYLSGLLKAEHKDESFLQ